MDSERSGRAEPPPTVVAIGLRGATGAAPSAGGAPAPAALDEALAVAGLDALIASLSGPDARMPRQPATRDDDAVDPAPRATILVGLGAVTFTAPGVLAAVLERLDRAGLVVRVLAAVPSRDRDLGWSAASLTARHGYPPGLVLDPQADLIPSGFPEASLHHDRPIARQWLEADLRIVLAPCATDAGQGFVGVLAALAGLAPRIPGADPADAVADLAAHAPADFAVLDATVVSHGALGTAVRRELHADTLVASRSAMLADLVAGSLLGLDPGVSPTFAACLAMVGLPSRHSVLGDLRKLPGVETPSIPLIRSLPQTGGSAGLARVLAAAVAIDAAGAPASGATGEPLHDRAQGAGDPTAERDPDAQVVVIAGGPGPGDPLLDALRSALRPWVMATTESPTAVTALTGLQTVAALAADAVTAWRINFAKHTLARVEAPLGLDLSGYRAADYEAVHALLAPLVAQAAALPDTGDPLKWQHLDGSVLFEVSRTVRADYRSWVERVDISQAIRFMADYLGGRRVVVARDRSGRPVRQAERNLYLPQPNYVAFSGGRVIDVCKLEVIRHHRDSSEIWWRTVHSPNGSADYDDGTIEFADVGPGRTRITIRGRQRFTLPLFWQVVDIDRFPGAREVLTTDAYRRFFTTTLDNFEACYEGRPFEIGRPPVDRGLATRDLSALLAMAREGVQEHLSRGPQESAPGPAGLLGELVRPWAAAALGRPAPGGPAITRIRPPDAVDTNGFRHFRGERRD